MTKKQAQHLAGAFIALQTKMAYLCFINIFYFFLYSLF